LIVKRQCLVDLGKGTAIRGGQKKLKTTTGGRDRIFEKYPLTGSQAIRLDMLKAFVDKTQVAREGESKRSGYVSRI